MAKKNNSNLHAARNAKNDEFYTQFKDIEKEMWYYKDFFNGKIVYCNCDDPIDSNFTKFFILKFREWGIKRLICTFFDIENRQQAYAFIYNGEDMDGDGEITIKDYNLIKKFKAFRVPLVADEKYSAGDFRSNNCVEYLKQADVVVTNPPFSLFREYVAQLMEYDKKFIIIGNGNAVTYKEIFPLIMNNQMWIGASNGIGGKFTFITTDDYNGKFVEEIDGKKIAQVNNACWFTNIEHKKRNEPLDLYKRYSFEEYPKYDNYDAIESKTEKIPMDYDGVIGVPITFLDKYCPAQFKIVGMANNVRYIGDFPCLTIINGVKVYNRILIKKISH